MWGAERKIREIRRKKVKERNRIRKKEGNGFKEYKGEVRFSGLLVPVTLQYGRSDQ